MTSPTIRPYQPGDAGQVTGRDGDNQPMLTDQQAMAGPAYTAVLGERVIGCAGLVMLWPGVAAAWMVLSEDIGAHRFWLTRIVRRFLGDFTRAFRLHRVEAWALAESVRNQRWLWALGFKPEGGIARQYLSDRRDVIRYERVEG